MNKSVITAQAKTLVHATKQFSNKNITHSESLEILSVLYGFKNYNELANYINTKSAVSEMLDIEQEHAAQNQDAWTNETVITNLSNGRRLHAPAYPADCDYVRVVDRCGQEVAYWHEAEWSESPMEVMGAILGAVNGGKHRMLPAFAQKAMSNKAEVISEFEHYEKLALKEPLSRDQLQHYYHNQARVVVVLKIPMSDIENVDIDGLNDIVEEMILGENHYGLEVETLDTVDAHLQDINYKTVYAHNDILYIEVNSGLDFT